MITLKANSLVVDGWEIKEKNIVRFFSAVEAEDEGELEREREELLLRAVKIGVIALQRAETQVDLDAVRQEFDGWHREVEELLERIFKEDDGKLALVLGRYLGEGGHLADLFDAQRKDSAIGRIQAIFDDHFTGDGAKFARLLDCSVPDSPLRKLQEAMDKRFGDVEGKLNEISQQMAAEQARKAQRELGTAKGLDFEELLYDLLADIARPFGDQVVRVGDVPGSGGSKKGDFLIELNGKSARDRQAKVLVEAKRQKMAGTTSILRDLQDAMKTRDACYAIAVFSEDACPNEVGGLREYPNNRVLCSVPADGSEILALELAYRLVRAQVCLQLEHEFREIDYAAVANAIRAAKEKLGQFTALKHSATRVVNSAKDLRSQLDLIEEEIRDALDGILRELETAPIES